MHCIYECSLNYNSLQLQRLVIVSFPFISIFKKRMLLPIALKECPTLTDLLIQIYNKKKKGKINL